MTQHCLYVAVGFLAALTLGSVTRAADDVSPDAKKQIAALEAQVKALQAQITLLKKELEDAKATIRFMSESASRPHADAPKEPATSGTPAASSSAPRKTERPTIAAPVDLLRDMPAELRPKPNVGWDKFLAPKVEAWVKEQKPDAVLDTRIELVEVHVRRATDSEKQRWKTNNEWRVAFTFAPRDVPFGTVTFDQVIGDVAATNSLHFYWGEDMARRAEKLKKGSMVRIRGTVLRMEFDYRTFTPTRAKLAVLLGDAALPEIEP